MKKNLLFVVLSVLFASCNWVKEKPEVAIVLGDHFKNKLFDKFDTAAYKPIFMARLALKDTISINPKTIAAFYERNEYLPLLTTRFYANGALDSLKSYLGRSKEEGFNAEIFNYSVFSTQLQILAANKFKSIDEVYRLVADLELNAAIAVNKYTSMVKYGSINPRNYFNRYYIPVKRLDSAKMNEILNTDDLVTVLRQSQQTAKPYLLLKQALAHYRDSLRTDNNAAIKTIKINLERMRWQLPYQSTEQVIVNIPDFTLTWFNGHDTLAHMKVCLGAKREATYKEKMKAYLKSGSLDDKPKNHETPQLFSAFNAIQVNPIWNIPVSIAKSEIYWLALKDPYYLSNNNIKVYYKDKLVADPDTINWAKYPRDKLPFQFKQGSGDGNALGKFKFVFKNSASIYLHDTNNKNGFRMANRAISHGCVRVEQPLKFAELLVRDKYQYDQLRMDVNLPPVDTTKNKIFEAKLAKKRDTLNAFKLKPTWFAPRKNISIYMAYHTAWADDKGKVHFRPDVYEYDAVLWDAVKKYM